MANNSEFFRQRFTTYIAGQNQGYNFRSMNNSGTKVFCIFKAPFAADITALSVVSTSLTGTSPYYKMSVQGVTATANGGRPDGSIKESGTCVTADTQLTANSYHSLSVGAAYSVTAGEWLALVFEYADDGSTIDGSNYIKVVYGTSLYSNNPFSGYMTDGSTWVDHTNKYPALVAVTDNANFDMGGMQLYNRTKDYGVGDTGDRHCMKIVWPGTAPATYISGFTHGGIVLSPWASGTDWKYGIWNAAGAELVSGTYDTEYAAIHDSVGTQTYPFATSQLFEAGETYYIGFENTGVALTPEWLDVKNANALRSWPGKQHYFGSLWDGSSWTDHTDFKPCINLLLDDMEGGGGGGGSTTGATMGVIG